MTSRSRKKRQTTPPSTAARRAADAYRAVAEATAPPQSQQAEPLLWLPSGWLAIVLLLTAAVTAPAAEWRARGTAKQDAFRSTARSFVRPVQYQTVGYEDDIAGPQLRVASRGRGERSVVRDRFAQQPEADALEEAFEQPFGVDRGDPAVTDALEEALERPFGVRDPEPPMDEPEQTSEDLFEDLPADPFDEPGPEAEPEDLPAPDTRYDREPRFEEPAFDDRPTFDDRPAFEDEPADEMVEDAEEIESPYGVDAGEDAELAEERAKSAKDCAEELAEIKADRIDGIDLSIVVTGVEGEDYPFSCSIDDGTPFAPRCWEEVTYMWKASALCHKPLFFEDTQLERYGHSTGPYTQPLLSGAHFFSRVFVLPYNMGLTPPNECIYTLGHYRPGDCAPWMIEPVPFTWRAAIFQGAAATGVGAVLP